MKADDVQALRVGLPVERRVEEIVIELQRAVSEAPRRRSDLAITLEEIAVSLGPVLHNLEAERDLGIIGDDHGVPQPGDIRRGWRGRHGRASAPGRNGDKHQHAGVYRR